MLTQVISAFMVRKLTLVNERYKLCQWQEVFDVMLTVVIQRVFEKDVSSFPLFDKVGKMLEGRNQTFAIFTGEIITGKPRLPEGRGSNRACTFSQSVPELFQSHVLSARKCFLAKRRKKSKCFSDYTRLD